MRLKTAALLAATLTFTLVGCGQPTKKVVTVTGTVTYEGQKLKSGIVKFVAPNGDFAIGNIGRDGTFIVTDVVPGEQKVGYVAGPQGSGGPEGDKSAPTEKPVSVPAKFGDPQTSGVTVTVSESGGEVTIDLK